jgi:hypothetical protein
MREIYLFKLLCEYLLMHPEYLNSLNSNWFFTFYVNFLLN